MRYYVSTGKSLSESSRCWKFLSIIGDHAACRDMRSREIDTVDALHYLLECRQAVRTHLVDAITTQEVARIETRTKSLVEEHFAHDVGSESHLYHLLPAEITTLMRMHEDPSIPIADGDEVVFFIGHPDDQSSNAKDGFFCKALLSKLMDMGAFPRVRVSNHLLCWHPQGPRFDDVMDGAVDLCMPPFNLVLTGGFKGVILALAAKTSGKAIPNGHWAEYRQQGWRPHAYYIEQNSDTVVKIKLA